MQNNRVSLVISGGQTGIDQLGLEVARLLGIPTGGTAPKGYLTELGQASLLRDVYGLAEHSSAKYPPRTKLNVKQSDGTLLFGEMTGGTKLTLETCLAEGKPYIVNPGADELLAWLTANSINVLNVAGSRKSSLTRRQVNDYRNVLIDALSANATVWTLFAEKPERWGLRGDPYLWQELANLGEIIPLPASESDLHDLLVKLIKNLTGINLDNPGSTELASNDGIDVPRYQSRGGISNGMISPAYWVSIAIPLLKDRFNQLNSPC